MNLNQILHKGWTFFCGNYSDNSEGLSYGQLEIGSFITIMHPVMHHISCSFFMKYQISQLTQPSFSPDLAPYDFWLSKNQNHLWKGRDSRTLIRVMNIQQGSWWQLGELCEVPRYSEGDWGEQCFLYLVPSSVNVCIFHTTWLDTFWMCKIEIVCVYIYVCIHIYTHTDTHTILWKTIHMIIYVYGTCYSFIKNNV